MVQTRAHDYDLSTPIVEDLEAKEEDLTTEVETEKEVYLPHVTVHPLRDWGFNAFNHMDDLGGGSMVQDRYLGRADGIVFNDSKIRF
jgi:hypothetical protein